MIGVMANAQAHEQVVDHVHFHFIPKPAEAGDKEGLVIGWPSTSYDCVRMRLTTRSSRCKYLSRQALRYRLTKIAGEGGNLQDLRADQEQALSLLYVDSGVEEERCIRDERRKHVGHDRRHPTKNDHLT